MTPQLVSRFRRFLAATCLLATVWTMVLTLGGGFAIDLPGVTLSSRNPRNPALLALISGAVAWALPMRDRGRRTQEFWLRWTDRVSWLAARWPAWASVASVTALIGVSLQLAAWSGGHPMWVDEEMVALNVRDRALPDLAGKLWLDQSAPLGWLALERTALVILGTREAALRVVPVAFGMATLIVCAWAGDRWLGRLAAGVFVLLCGLGHWLAHYTLELKHYSADAFWAFLLPTLAAWTMEGNGPREQRHRVRIWWASAAVAHWFSNGGLLVAPACALLLLTASWRSIGWRAVVDMTVGGVVWLGSFALHYALSIRHTLDNDYFRRYWSGGLPPESLGLGGTLLWLASELRPLASNPGGSELPLLFWSVAILGCAWAPRHLRMMIASGPLSAFLLGALGVVPLLDRMALWIVPATYFAIACAADRATNLLHRANSRRSAAHLLAGAAMAVLVFAVCADIVQGGWRLAPARRADDSNHGLDDRSAVAWLMARRRPGDAIVTTHLALPAVWWYGGIDVSTGDPPGSRQQDGGPIFEADFVPGTDCPRDAALNALAGQRRVLVYVGFPDAPDGFSELLVRTLGRAGEIVADRMFAGASRAAVIDLTAPLQSASPADGSAGRIAGNSAAEPVGCVNMRLASRW
jgi:hypothetical protein